MQRLTTAKRCFIAVAHTVATDEISLLKNNYYKMRDFSEVHGLYTTVLLTAVINQNVVVVI